MKKKLGVICLVAVMIFSLTACGGSPQDQELDKAKQAVEGFINGFAKFDAKEMTKYMTEADAANAEDEITEEMFQDDESGTSFMSDVVKSMKCQYKSGEVKAEDTTARLTYTLTRTDISAIMDEYIKQLSESDFETVPSLNAKDFPSKDTEIKVDLVKKRMSGRSRMLRISSCS